MEEAFETLRLIRWAGITLTAIAVVLMLGVATMFAINNRRELASSKKVEQALTKVLSGYISICTTCKMIRDEDGAWHSVEKYISERSQAAFSHSICPECRYEHYGY